MVRAGGINKAGWLGAVHSLLKVAMEKGVFDVQLVDGPQARRGKGEHHTNGGWFDDRTESFVIVNAFLLGEATHNPSSFVASQRAISMELVTVDPFPCDDVDTCRLRNQQPSRVID